MGTPKDTKPEWMSSGRCSWTLNSSGTAIFRGNIKLEAVLSSEISVTIYQSKRRNMQESHNTLTCRSLSITTRKPPKRLPTPPWAALDTLLRFFTDAGRKVEDRHRTVNGWQTCWRNQREGNSCNTEVQQCRRGCVLYNGQQLGFSIKVGGQRSCHNIAYFTYNKLRILIDTSSNIHGLSRK